MPIEGPLAPEGIDWPVALGHLHPVLLHLPIGVLVALAALQLLARDQGQPGLRRAHGVLVLLLVVSTPAAAISGWLLHEGGGHGEAVETHERLGIWLAFLSLAIGLAWLRRSRAYGWFVGVALLFLLPTAHLGGTLTHGEDFLLGPFLGERRAPSVPAPAEGAPTNPAGEPQASVPVDPTGGVAAAAADAAPGTVAEAAPEAGAEASAVVRAAEGAEPGETPAPAPDAVSAAAPAWAEVHPVLERYCERCHGERKQRGGLALHTLEGALAGGDIGPALVPGDLEASLLWTRLHLPLEHEDHMPPASKSQPMPHEVELLRAWILGQPAGAGAPAAGEDLAGRARAPEPASGAGAPAALAEALAALTTRRLHVQALAAGSEQLWVDVGGARLEPGELAALVAPLSGHVVELAAGRQPLDGRDLTALAELRGLERLDLRGLTGQPRDLEELRGAGSLRRLNLAGTPLAPGALEVLAGLETLEEVHLWGTGLDAEALRARRPELRVVGASAPPSEPAEVEPEVRFRRPGEVESETPPVVPAAALVNQVCPVSGSPVDPAHFREVAGRRIGFCCPNCPRTFDADPAPFLAELGIDPGTPAPRPEED